MTNPFDDDLVDSLRLLLPLDRRYAVDLHRILVDVTREQKGQTLDIEMKYKLHRQLLKHTMEMGKELFQGVYVLTGVRDD